ncbi:MAG: glycosyltransferase family 2 protein [Ornithinibacter sp.]
MHGRVSAIMLGYGSEEHLEEALAALVASVGDAGEVVLVDNGIADAARRRVAWPAQVVVVQPGENTGFSGGCHLGVDASCGDTLVFVNSDAVVEPAAVRELVASLDDPGVAIAGGCLLLADSPDRVNSVGNPLHFSGITWAGSMGEPVEDHAAGTDVAVATGGLFALHRVRWDSLGGFDPMYFAYNEDTDLCVRARLSGARVVYVPAARAVHHYEFGRSPLKMYLVERNRLITVLTDFPSGLLRRVLPALLVIEPLLLVQSLLQGWSRQKVSSWVWVLRHWRVLRERRERVQSAVTHPGALDGRLVARIEPPMVQPPPGMGLVNTVLALYWRLAGPGQPE